jgi:membrane protein
MNIIQRVVAKIDTVQRRQKPLAFVYAVIKKYGDDQAGYQAALVTYYGFLALFPLLLVLTTVAGIAGSRNPEFGAQLVDSVSRYFPGIGQSLQDAVNGSGRTGLALLIGTLFSLYGARGIADAFRNAANHIWHVPIDKRSGFPRSLIRSFGIIFGGGAGFLAASIIAGLTTNAGHGVGFKALSILINLVILYGVFMLILRLSLPLGVALKQFRLAAAISALGITALQLIGGAVLAAHASSLSTSYSALFATTLGLLAWIYLQSQVIMYALEVNTVKNGKFWPRGLTDDNPTAADKKLKPTKA